MAASTVRPRINSSVLRNAMRPRESLAEFAQRLGFCVTETHKLIGKSQGENPRVRMKTIKQICESLNISIGDIIFYDARALPQHPAFFESLKFGYFVDNNRNDFSGEETWFGETIDIREETVSTADGGRLCFTGTIKNCIGIEFSIKAERLADHLFYMASASGDPRRSFVGCANHYVRYEHDDLDVISGTWSGLDVAGDPAVFRWVLSNRQITRQEINMICEDINIKDYFETDKFHEYII
jgi:DNA-binding Xre family transcriptional regulator